MAKASKVSPTLNPNISHDDGVDDNGDEDNDEESDNIASLKIKGEMIFKTLYKNKLACSNFLEIMSIATEGKKYIEELEAHLEEHEATIETMEAYTSSGTCVDTNHVEEIKELKDQMDKIVNIHYVDKEAFMNVAIVDKYEEVLIFLDSPTYEEVVAETRIRLKWVDPSDQVELLGRYDVGSAHKCRMKTMPIKSNLHWVAYKEAVASLIDKSLEVLASTVVNAPLHVDLNQPSVDDLSPYNGVSPIVEHKVEVQVNEYPQYEFGGSAPIKDDGHDSDEEYERQHNIVCDVEAQVRHDDMDPDIVYQRACVDESDDEGPVNELDEDGFTEKEAEWCTKITGRDHKVPLFCDVSLADKALVDGGMSKTIEARMFPSSTPNAICTSYLMKGLMFEDILELKKWLCEYAVKHYRPFRVVHSDCHKR
ncbi:hypothetical protein D1007_24006 [Hordeum vulgare]|nr:hypothetical protein D1007_24006 [Hordeum vulgare]